MRDGGTQSALPSRLSHESTGDIDPNRTECSPHLSLGDYQVALQAAIVELIFREAIGRLRSPVPCPCRN